MCGIAGLLNPLGRPADPQVVRAMTDRIAHRGPDGEGWFLEGEVALGHRRLAILDLSDLGRQPMATADGRYTLTYNGEIYNFAELKRELEALGHAFRSRTDTEVLLHGYAQWGPAVLPRLNGMFAFALWDRDRRSLFLARDRYGIKPLYYAFAGDTFLFASENKAFLAHPEFRPAVDPEGLLEYFTFQNFFTDRTLLRGVRMLPAGTCAEVRLAPGRAEGPRIDTYWDFDFREPEAPASGPEYLEELDRLFTQAVTRQLVSDVPVGSYLSGGMDSGSITAIAAGTFPYLKTFTCGFDLHSISGLELGFDEREQAEWMSYLFRTEHYEMVLKAGDMERILPSLAWHLEEPRVGQMYPNFYTARLASRFVKVVLGGAGGDELFGGYPWRYYRALRSTDFDHYVENYYRYWHRLMDGDELRQVFRPVWGEVGQVCTRDIFRGVFRRHASSLVRPEDYVNHSLYLEAKTFLHGLLVMEDKLSMAHGLETRVPFLDNDLVDFAVQVPVRCKLRNIEKIKEMDENDLSKYSQRNGDGKVLLREMMERHIPPEITQGVKQGFSAPDASWFKGDSIQYVRQRLFNPAARLYGFLDAAAVQDLVTGHLEGRQNRRLLIWSLLNLECWLEKFI